MTDRLLAIVVTGVSAIAGVASEVLAVGLSDTTPVELGGAIKVGVFILGGIVTGATTIIGVAWWLSARLQKGTDTMEILLKHQQWQLDNHATLSESQRELELQVAGLRCRACDLEYYVPKTKLIGHPHKGDK